MAKVKYRNTWLRVLISFFASTFILIHGLSLDDLILSFSFPTFYIAIAFSFTITLIFVYWIHVATKKLDSQCDWRKNTLERIFWQFLFGVVLPCLLDIGAMAIHSALIGGNFNTSDFLAYDFPVIASFFIVVNMYYAIYYLLKADSKVNSIVGNSKEPSILTIDYNRTFVQLSSSDILCFYRSGNLVNVVTNDNEFTTKASLSLDALEEKYMSENFIRINRGAILNMCIVKGYSQRDKRSLHVIFYEPIKVKEQVEDQFIVSEKYIQLFKSKFNQISS